MSHWIKRLFGFGHVSSMPPVPLRVESLQRFYNIHQGRRAFLVGNGPSMREEYFELLQGEITFGFNGICRLFHDRPWRPTYLMIHDQVVAEPIRGELVSDPTVECIVGEGLRDIFTGYPKVTYYKLPYPLSPDKPPPFRTDLENGLQGGWTVAYCGLQMAWYMGIREVYLLGVDLEYKVAIDRVVGDYHVAKKVIGDFAGSYFDPRLTPTAETTSTLPNTEGMLCALKQAGDFYSRNGGRIMNAAPDSPLSIFPRSGILAELGVNARK